MQRSLDIKGLKVNRDGKEIVKGIDLRIPAGEVHVLMGPNGSGKSSLVNSLMGHPAYEVTGGSVLMDGKDILVLPTEKRAQAGLFLSPQYPPEIGGISVANFIRAALAGKEGTAPDVSSFRTALYGMMETLGIERDFAKRSLNQGFSGGEKKRIEVLQLMMLKPSYALLDETDSGLDVDALKTVAEGIASMRGPGFGALIVTHYTRILEYVRPDHVHVMKDGVIVASGDMRLAERIESEGYDTVITNTD